MEEESGVSEVPDAKSDDLSKIPRNHVEEGEN